MLTGPAPSVLAPGMGRAKYRRAPRYAILSDLRMCRLGDGVRCMPNKPLVHTSSAWLLRPFPVNRFRLPPTVSHLSHGRFDFGYLNDGLSLSLFITLLEMLDALLSDFPNAEQLEARDFDLNKLIETLERMVTDDDERNKILQLTGDSAALVIECLDKASVGEPPSHS